MGGDPKEVSKLISDNMGVVLEVRSTRRQTAMTTIGVIYGMSLAVVFSFFIGIGITEIMIDIIGEMDNLPEQFDSLFHADLYNMNNIRLAVMGLIILNAVISSLMIRVVDRGRFITALPHLVVLTWLSVAVALASEHITRALFGM